MINFKTDGERFHILGRGITVHGLVPTVGAICTGDQVLVDGEERKVIDLQLPPNRPGYVGLLLAFTDEERKVDAQRHKEIRGEA